MFPSHPSSRKTYVNLKENQISSAKRVWLFLSYIFLFILNPILLSHLSILILHRGEQRQTTFQAIPSIYLTEKSTLDFKKCHSVAQYFLSLPGSNRSSAMQRNGAGQKSTLVFYPDIQDNICRQRELLWKALLSG